MTGGTSGQDYAARFAALARSGKDMHGEARFCASLVPAGARVLDAGCGTGRVMIRLARLGYECVGVDLDASMLAVARKQAPELPWFQADLAEFAPAALGVAADFDLVVAAGNIFPLLAAGTETTVVERLAAALRPGGLLVAGFAEVVQPPRSRHAVHHVISAQVEDVLTGTEQAPAVQRDARGGFPAT
ncbi:class I SAM-dependent methyltransferase [Streptomyces sp. NPDC002076]